MNKYLKKIAMVLTILLIVSSIRVTTVSEAATAVPQLNVKGKVLNGIGRTYKVYVKNQRAGCKYSWSSANTKLMTVTASGATAIMKAVSPGWTKVNCTITYPGGTKRVLSATVLVRIPPTKVEVSNANLVNGVHTMKVDSTFDFNRSLTPSNSSDHTYWKVTPSDFGTISAYGVFTPSGKIGSCTITATAAPYRSYISRSKILHTINVNIIEKDAVVNSVELKGADELSISFSTAMAADTLINPVTKELQPSIVISARKNEKGEQAEDFGVLSGEMSEDKKSISIRSTKTFNGTYTVCLTSEVKTVSGAPLETYAKTVSLMDTMPPAYLGSEIDDSGMKTTLRFNETIDVNSLSIAAVESPQSVSTLERDLLMMPTNYLLSKDGKSITIDMSSICQPKTTKSFIIQMQGIKDRNGNSSKTNFLEGYVYYDTSEKPQATVINISRTGYETVTVEYSRSIQPYSTGTLIIGDTVVQSAFVDPDNNRLVHYNLPAQCTTLKGMQLVSISGWNSYNVPASDNSSYNKVTRGVNFSVDTIPPTIQTVKLENVKGAHILTLEYSEPVTIGLAKGTLIARIITDNQDVLNNNTINYTAVVEDRFVKLTLQSSQMGKSGKYTFNLPNGFVRDAFYNLSALATPTVASNASLDTVLPAPQSILQSSLDANVITISFANKLDLETAQNIANYNVAGATISRVEVDKNTTEAAIINLIMSPGSIRYNTNYTVTINGVRGYNNTFNPLVNYQQVVALKENVAPKILYARLNTDRTAINVTFDDSVVGIASYDIYVNGKRYKSANEVSIAYGTNNVGTNYTMTIYFGETLPIGASVAISPTQDNSLMDQNGNKAQINSMVYVY